MEYRPFRFLQCYAWRQSRVQLSASPNSAVSEKHDAGQPTFSLVGEHPAERLWLKELQNLSPGVVPDADDSRGLVKTSEPARRAFAQFVATFSHAAAHAGGEPAEELNLESTNRGLTDRRVTSLRTSIREP